MEDERRIAAVDEVPEEGTLLFRVTDGDGEREAILVRLSDGIAGWFNECQHWTDVPLDRGDGARVRNGEVWCQKHGATFETDTGYCNFGPCEGAYLNAVEVRVDDGDVYLDDGDYDLVGLGPMERDGDGGGAPGGRIDFTGS